MMMPKEQRMLTDLDVAHFHAFGYVRLRNCLEAEELDRLQRAFDRVIATDPRVTVSKAPFENGTRTLCPFAEADGAFTDLIEHPRIMEAMREIDGTEFLYSGAEDMSSFVGDTMWQCDFFPPHNEFRPVEATFYLDPMRADDGALRLIPGTHIPEFAAQIFRMCGHYGDTGGPRLRLEPRQVPSVPIETDPGDVVLWENHMWHFAARRQNGEPRRAMFVQYYRDPKDDPIAAKGIREAIADIQAKHKPYVYSRGMLETASPGREKMAARLEAIGVANVRQGAD
jgi:hypothetical protein